MLAAWSKHAITTGSSYYAEHSFRHNARANVISDTFLAVQERSLWEQTILQHPKETKKLYREFANLTISHVNDLMTRLDNANDLSSKIKWDVERLEGAWNWLFGGDRHSYGIQISIWTPSDLSQVFSSCLNTAEHAKLEEI